MKKIVLSLAICGALLLSACSKTGENDPKGSATNMPSPSVSEQSTPSEDASAASMEVDSSVNEPRDETINAAPMEGGEAPKPGAGSAIE